MKAKRPQPAVGDRVKLKGRPQSGTLKALGKDPGWAHVEWDADAPGPKWVHITELEKA